MTSRAEAEGAILLALRRMLVGSVLTNDAIARRAGLNVVDGQALHLMTLADHPMTPGELSGASGMPTSTVTRVLDRLERAGFVRRVADPHDRRKVSIELDGERIAALSHEYDQITTEMDDVFGGFTIDELAVVQRFLERAGAVPAAAPAGAADAAR